MLPLLKTTLLLLLCGFLQPWKLPAQTAIPYAGTFHNTLLDAGGTITMTVIFWPGDSISGHVDFTEYPGNSPLCAAGNFTGRREADSLFHSFISFDTDPGCGFEWGATIYLLSQLHNGTDSITGEYWTDPSPTLQGLGYYTLRATTPTGVHNTGGHDRIRAFPNPTKGLLSLDVAGKASHLTLYDATGRNLMERSVLNRPGPITIDLGGRDAGYYLIQVALQDGSLHSMQVIKE